MDMKTIVAALEALPRIATACEALAAKYGAQDGSPDVKPEKPTKSEKQAKHEKAEKPDAALTKTVEPAAAPERVETPEKAEKPDAAQAKTSEPVAARDYLGEIKDGIPRLIRKDGREAAIKFLAKYGAKSASEIPENQRKEAASVLQKALAA